MQGMRLFPGVLYCGGRQTLITRQALPHLEVVCNGLDICGVGLVIALTEELEGKVDCLILTSSSADQMDAFRHENQMAVPFAFADVTVLKTIVRSNPGLSLWKDGVVLGNWHHNDTPAPADILGLLGQR